MESFVSEEVLEPQVCQSYGGSVLHRLRVQKGVSSVESFIHMQGDLVSAKADH